MDFAPDVIGIGTAKKLEDKGREALLTIGKDTFTRAAFANVACFNFTAAANLQRVLDKEGLAVRDTKELFERVTPDDLALPRLGAVSLAALGAAFLAKGIGGEAPLSTWYHRHRKLSTIKFATLKVTLKRARRERAAAQRQRRGLKLAQSA